MIIKEEKIDNYKLDYMMTYNEPFTYYNLSIKIKRNQNNIGKIFRGKSCNKPLATSIASIVDLKLDDLFD